MDEFLFFLGLYRSDVAIDETCLYRAVSEQIFHSQVYHNDIKQQCKTFMKCYSYLFENDLGPIEHYLRKIDTTELWAGIPEMKVLSILYDLEFEVFFEVGKPPRKITNGNHKVVLVGFTNNRYDLVFSRDELALSAICQSLTYEVLYKNVFKFGEDVKMAVEKMLHDKEYSKQRRLHLAQGQTCDLMDQDFKEEQNVPLQNVPLNHQDSTIIKKALSQGIPPFPYKIAKTLDPYIYRNVEFDVWNEKRKMEQNQQLIPPLSPGVKCLVLSGKEGVQYTGHIQELNTESTASVFIEELGRIADFDVADLSIIPIPACQVMQGMNRTVIRRENIGMKFDGLDKKFKKRGLRKYFKESEPQSVQTANKPQQYFGGNRQRSMSQNPLADSGYQSGKRTNPRRYCSNVEQSAVQEFETPRRNFGRPRCCTLESTTSPRCVSRPEIFICHPDATSASFPNFSSTPNPPSLGEASPNMSNVSLMTSATEGGNVDFHSTILPSLNYSNIAQSSQCLNDSGEFNCPSIVQATPPMDIPNATPTHTSRPMESYVVSFESDPRSVAFPASDNVYVYPAATPMMINNGAVPYYYNTPPQAGLVQSWIPPNGTATAMSWPMTSYYPFYNPAYQVPMTPPWTPPTYPSLQPYLPAPDVARGYVLPPVAAANYSSYTATAAMGSAVLPSAPYMAYSNYILN